MIMEAGKSKICRLETQESECADEVRRQSTKKFPLWGGWSFCRQASTDWMKPTHAYALYEGQSAYLKLLSLNINLI